MRGSFRFDGLRVRMMERKEQRRGDGNSNGNDNDTGNGNGNGNSNSKGNTGVSPLRITKGKGVMLRSR